MRPEFTIHTAPRASVSSPAPRTVVPAVQQLADTLGVDVEKLTGTGAGGRVTTNDVRRAHGRQGGVRPAATHSPTEVFSEDEDRQLSAMLALPKGSFRRG